MDTGSLSTVGCPHSTVAIYDSMYRCAGKHVKSQVACLLHSEAPKIYLNFMDTQIQAGGCDCGLFAIANATALAHMDDPGKLFYDQKKMRQHLFQCLEKGIITPFPVKKKRRALRKISETAYFDVHCICRLPEGAFLNEEWGVYKVPQLVPH